MDEDQYNINPNIGGPTVVATPIGDVLNTITSFKTLYPDNPDHVLLYLRSITSPDAIPIDNIVHVKLNSVIQSTCDYILQTYYPFSDDACDIFIIQAQGYVRFGTWHDYPQILQYCDWAQQCSPSFAQKKLIREIEDKGYNYKLKSYIERGIIGTISTWFTMEGFILFANLLFPFEKTARDYKFDEIKSIRNPDGSIDIEQYVTHLFPRPLSEIENSAPPEFFENYEEISANFQGNARNYLYPHHYLYDQYDNEHNKDDGDYNHNDDDDDDDYDDDE